MNKANAALPRIGILGGMGPLASAEFVVKLVQATPAACDQEHFATTLDSSPQIPDRPTAIFRGGPDPLPGITEVIRRLEAAGCALITMPCNTVHYWYEAMTALTSLPIVHIADAVAASLKDVAPGAKRVGVLAAAVLTKLGIYSQRLGDDEWEWVYASDELLDTVVLPGIAAVKAGDLSQARTLLLRAAQEFVSQGVDAIVLACTEIPVVLGQADIPVPVVDSTEALARYTVAVAQGMRGSGA